MIFTPLLKPTTMALIVVGLLSACSTTGGSDTKVDYQSARKGNTLEIPPGMTDFERSNRYDVDGAVRASKVATDKTKAAAIPAAAPTTARDMYIERAGTTRWLVVNLTPEQVWEGVQNFWQDGGFTLKTNQMRAGVMETDWAENRASLPETGLRSILGGVLDSVYDTGFRDMFRTRVERTAKGAEIYISHRGMEEVYVSASKDQTKWQSRPVDPALEAEMLQRLMAALSGDATGNKPATTADKPAAAEAVIAQDRLLVSDNLENTWRRIGLSLDRTGLSVIDRDYAKHVYYVTPNPDDRGLFSSNFGKLAETYQVEVKAISATQTSVQFLDKSGKPYTGSGLTRVLERLQESLK